MAAIIITGLYLSPFVRFDCMAAIEKGVAYELRAIADLADLKTPEHLARHPWGKMPTLEHDGFVLFESQAIARYIDEAFAGPALQPREAKARARMNQWLGAVQSNLVASMLGRYVVQYLFPKGPDGTPDRAAIEAAFPDIKRDAAIVDGALARSRYLAGAELSLADLALAPILDNVRMMPEGPALLEGFAHLGRYYDELSTRPSFTATRPSLPPGMAIAS